MQNNVLFRSNSSTDNMNLNTEDNQSVRHNRGFKKRLLNVLIICMFSSIVLLTISAVLFINSSCSRQAILNDTTTTYNRTDNVSTTTIIETSNDHKSKSVIADTTIKKAVAIDETISKNNHSDVLDSIVYNLTLAVNSISNILSSGAIALGLLTLFIAIVGLFGFHTLKDDIKEHKREISKYIRKIESLDDKIKESETKEKALNKSIVSLNTFLDQVDEVLFSSANAITTEMDIAKQLLYDKINDEEKENFSIIDENSNNKVLRDLNHQIKRMQLYKLCINENIDSNVAFAIFAHFKAAGEKEDYSDLQYVADNCQNVNYSKEAEKTIWYIEQRLLKEKK